MVLSCDSLTEESRNLIPTPLSFCYRKIDQILWLRLGATGRRRDNCENGVCAIFDNCRVFFLLFRFRKCVLLIPRFSVSYLKELSKRTADRIIATCCLLSSSRASS